MSYTKRQLISGAFTEAGLAEYEFDIAPEQLEEGLRRLDSMMAEWSIKKIRLGYLSPITPAESDVDAISGIPNYAVEAVICNLAIKIATGHGKQVSMHTLSAASNGLNTLMAISARPREMRLPVMPSGAGNKGFETPFMGGEDSDVIKPLEPSINFG
jgi:hypothetical protein